MTRVEPNHGMNPSQSESETGQAPTESDLRRLEAFLSAGSVLVLSGAGISTESGIPDYRGPTGRLRESSPIQYREFVSSAVARQRYWARSAIGWPRVRAARPNAGHRAVAALEHAGIVHGIITQNVDGLHQAAGSSNVVELHGTLYQVTCLQCDRLVDRETVQREMLQANPGWEASDALSTPDGDAVLDPEEIDGFRTPECRVCGGELKPHVVFFGENVPRAVVDRAWELLERSRAVLVAGSSLTVYSGFRFVDRAVRQGRPVAVVNIGPTRADSLAGLKIEAPLGAALTQVANRILRAAG